MDGNASALDRSISNNFYSVYYSFYRSINLIYKWFTENDKNICKMSNIYALPIYIFILIQLQNITIKSSYTSILYFVLSTFKITDKIKMDIHRC